MAEKTKKDEKMDGWLHMPQTSIEYNFCKIIESLRRADVNALGQELKWMKLKKRVMRLQSNAMKRLE